MDLSTDERIWLINKIQKLHSEGNSITAACKLMGKSRTFYYKWLNRFKKEGESGLVSRSRAHHTHPMKTPDYVKEEIIRLASEDPNMNYRKIETYLKNGNYSDEYKKSRTVIQEILNDCGLGKMADRWKYFTDKLFEENRHVDLAKHRDKIKKYNPELYDEVFIK
jgi:transposase